MLGVFLRIKVISIDEMFGFNSFTSGVLPKDRGMMPVIEHLRENIANESCVKQALDYLATLSKEDGMFYLGGYSGSGIIIVP